MNGRRVIVAVAALAAAIVVWQAWQLAVPLDVPSPTRATDAPRVAGANAADARNEIAARSKVASASIRCSVQVEDPLLLANLEVIGEVDAREVVRGQVCADGSLQVDGFPANTAGRVAIRGRGVATAIVDIAALSPGAVHDLGLMRLQTSVPLHGSVVIDGAVGTWLGNEPPWVLDVHTVDGEQHNEVVRFEPGRSEFVWTMHTLHPGKVRCDLRVVGRRPMRLEEGMAELSRDDWSLRMPPFTLTRDTVVMGTVVDDRGAALPGSEVYAAEDTDELSKERFFTTDDARFLLPNHGSTRRTFVAAFGTFVSSPTEWTGDAVTIVVAAPNATRVRLLDADGKPVSQFGCGRSNWGRRPISTDRDAGLRRATDGVVTLKSKLIEGDTWVYFWGPGFHDFRVRVERDIPGGAPWTVRIQPSQVAKLTVQLDHAADVSISLTEIDGAGQPVSHGWRWFRVAASPPASSVVFDDIPLARYRCEVRGDQSRVIAFGDADLGPEGTSIPLVIVGR